ERWSSCRFFGVNSGDARGSWEGPDANSHVGRVDSGQARAPPAPRVPDRDAPQELKRSRPPLTFRSTSFVGERGDPRARTNAASPLEVLPRRARSTIARRDVERRRARRRTMLVADAHAP